MNIVAMIVETITGGWRLGAGGRNVLPLSSLQSF
jgi:hypothetical protein